MFHQLIKNIEIGLACFDLIIMNDGFNSIESSLISFKMSDQGVEEDDIDVRNLLDWAWNSRSGGWINKIWLMKRRSGDSVNSSIGFTFRNIIRQNETSNSAQFGAIPLTFCNSVQLWSNSLTFR